MISKYKYSHKQNQFSQNTVYNSIDQLNIKNIEPKPIINQISVNSNVNLSDFNIIKAQKYLIMRSIFNFKVKLNKQDENLILSFKTFDRRKIDEIVYLILKLNSIGDRFFLNNGVEIMFKDLLLNLRRLDFLKVSEKSLTNIFISLNYMNKNKYITNKWFINEIFCKERS